MECIQGLINHRFINQWWFNNTQHMYQNFAGLGTVTHQYPQITMTDYSEQINAAKNSQAYS